MIEMRALIIEHDDIDHTKDKRLPFQNRLKPEAEERSLTAPLVIMNGEIVKNRNGTITRQHWDLLPHLRRDAA